MTETPSIRIVIADDHPLVRDGLRRLFELEPGFVVVGEAADGEEAVARVRELKPDVLLLDLAMPRMSGLDVLRALSQGDHGARTILLTAAIEREETVDALRLGAHGVILKDSATQMLCKSVRAVMNGEYWVGRGQIGDLLEALRRIERETATAEATPASRLTQRELQLIAAVVEGASNKDAGKQFGLSEQTVKNHLSNVFDKLGVSNRLELALYAVHHHLLDRRKPGAAGTSTSVRLDRRKPGAGGTSTSVPKSRT